MPQFACQWTDWDATWVAASYHVPNIGNAIILLTMRPIGTTLEWSRSSNTSAAKPFLWYWSLNHTVNVLVLWGVEIKNSHNFDEIRMTVPLKYNKIKSRRKTANINTKKP